MAYARKSRDSDVYVYAEMRHAPGDPSVWVCQECIMVDRDYWAKSRGDMLIHLAAHQAMEHKVPEDAVTRLKDEVDKELRGLDPSPTLATVITDDVMLTFVVESLSGSGPAKSIGGEPLRDLLVPLLDHKSPLVREATLHGLLAGGALNEAVWEKVKQMAETDSIDAVREAARDILMERTEGT